MKSSPSFLRVLLESAKFKVKEDNSVSKALSKIECFDPHDEITDLNFEPADLSGTNLLQTAY